MASLTSQGNANQAIIREFNSGRRPLLALGLTPHYTVAVFGGPHGQADSSKWYAYQMPTSAYTPDAGHMFKLSNGGLVSKKWPAFYKALGNKSPSFMVTIHDQVSEYVLASFGSSSVPGNGHLPTETDHFINPFLTFCPCSAVRLGQAPDSPDAT